MEPKSIKITLNVGTEIGRYIIREILGSGGFGITYKAWDPELKRWVAIKEYLPKDTATRDHNTLNVHPHESLIKDYQFGLDRFLKEAEILAKFRHINIVGVLDYYRKNNTAYLIMNFEQGQTLTQHLRTQGGLLEEGELKVLLKSILKGLEHIHEKDYYHRDIKPSNIYLRKGGEPLLIDFGAARQALNTRSMSLTVIGSPGYSPSEQYRSDSKNQGPWTDLYALGATLYHCITGKAPIDAHTRSAALLGREGDPLVPALILGKGRYATDFLKLIDWMLQPDTRDRPQNVEAVLDCLYQKLDSQLRIKTEDLIADSITVLSERTIAESESPSKHLKRNLWISGRAKKIVGIIFLVLLTIAGISQQKPLLQYLKQFNLPDGGGRENPVITRQPTIPDVNDTEVVVENGGTSESETSRKHPGLVQRPTIARTNGSEGQSKDKAQPSIQTKQSETGRLGSLGKQPIVNKPSNQVQKPKIKQQEDPDPQPITDGASSEEIALQERLADLLEGARIDVLELHLSSPKGDNAIEKYQKVLRLDPQNQEAQQGLNTIVGKYFVHAQTAQAKRSFLEAANLLDIAKSILPRHPGLQSAEENLEEAKRAFRREQGQLPKIKAPRQADGNSRRPRNLTTPLDDMKFIAINPGCFQMGSTTIENRPWEQPVHRVCLNGGYDLGKYEVTQAQWQRVMGDNPSKFKGGNKPVENISWNDIQSFIEKLNRQTGKNNRLPTEAEWEYACRSGGKDQKYCGSDIINSVAWYRENAGGATHPVGQKQPNGLGLYDMSGNVWEWVQDRYGHDYYSKSPTNNPKGPSGGSYRVRRGGGWSRDANFCRSVGRYIISTDGRSGYLGFRLARTR